MAWDDKIPMPIRQARLLHLPAFLVYEELKQYGTFLEGDRYGWDQKLEAALLAKGDPLINLGLAQFGGSKEVASELYKRSFSTVGDSSYNRALRIAVLGNKVLPNQLFSGTFGVVDDAELIRLATSGEPDEIWPMLTNPSAKKLVAKLYNQNPPFDKIPTERLISMVYISHSNPCINDDDSNMHGPDLTAWDLQKGVWKLLKELPVTEDAMDALYWLLKSLHPRRTGLAGEDPAPILKRWQAVQISEKFKKSHSGMQYTNLGLQEEFGVLLAAHYAVGAIDEPDLLQRCAHYSHAKLSVEQMQQSHNRDGDAFTLAALYNEQLYWDNNTRAILERLIRGRLIGLYRRRCEQIHKSKPQFDSTAVSETGALLLDEEKLITAEQKRLERVELQLAVTGKQLTNLLRMVQWVLVLLVVSLVVLWQRH